MNGDHTSQIEKTEILRRLHPVRIMAGTAAYMVMVGSKAIGIITQYRAGFEPIYGNTTFPLQESLDIARRIVEQEFERDMEKVSEAVVVPQAGLDTQVSEQRLKAWVLAADVALLELQAGDLNRGIEAVVNLRRQIDTEIVMRVGK